MNRLVMAILCTSIAAGAAITAVHSTSTESAPRASGLDLAGADRKVRPQDDLFRFVNGEWLRTTQIPPDRSNYGAFTMLDDKAQADLRALIEEAAAKPNRAPGSDEQKMGDFYKSFMDTARVDGLGLKPLAAELARIDALASRAALNRYLGEAQFLGLSQPVGLYIAQDEKNTTAYIPIVVQSGLTLPDRDYYLKDEEKYAKIREKYLAYVARTAELAGFADAAGTAKRVLALETRLAEAQWTRVQNRDAVATYNKHDAGERRDAHPGIRLARVPRAAGITTPDFIVTQPSYFSGFAGRSPRSRSPTGARISSASWSNDYAPYLSAPFVDAHFDLHGRTLKGTPEIRPRWKRAVEALDNTMGEMLGSLYVERHFPPEAKRAWTSWSGICIALVRRCPSTSSTG